MRKWVGTSQLGKGKGEGLCALPGAQNKTSSWVLMGLGAGRMGWVWAGCGTAAGAEPGACNR